MEVRYVVGPGLAIGAGRRWLLLDVPVSDDLVDELFDAVRGTDDLAGVVESLERAEPGLAVAAVDAGRTPQVRASRGAGRVSVEGDDIRLDLGGGTPGPTRRLVSGVVPAGELRLTGVGRRVGGGLIDGIPQEILDAAGPDGPPPRRPRMLSSRGHSGPLATADPDPTARPAPTAPDAAHPAGPDDDHPDRTSTGPRGPVSADAPPPEPGTAASAPPAIPPPPAPSAPSAAGSPALPAAATEPSPSTVVRAGGPEGPDHLQAGDVPSVLAVWCPAGHPTPVAAPTCRICRAVVAPQQAREIPRPVLGGLRLPTGEVVPLDRGVVLGRRPAPLPGAEDWPHLVHLGPEYGFVSRLHLHLELDGWLVLARDLSSRGGTTLVPPGRPGFRMQAQEPYALEPGTVLNLADLYAVRFEVGPEVVA